MPFPRACTKCNSVHTASGFYIQHGGDGRTRVCKECIKKGVREYRERNIEKVREYDRQRGFLEHRKEKVRARAHLYERDVTEWRKRNPEKYKSYAKVAYALRTGALKRPSACEKCHGEHQLDAHHDDYSKPLDVKWLCRPCHSERHRELNEERRQAQRKSA
jgi:hypothetical protein